MLGQALPTVSPAAFAVGVGSAALIFLLRRLLPNWPGMLIAVVLASLAAWLFHLPIETIGSHFGELPDGLPGPRLPAFSISSGPTVECLARLVQGTVCKILGQEEIKPHKVRYDPERRDAEFEQKMAEVLCVYREVQVLKKAAAKSSKAIKRVAIVSYDEKPEIQAIATTAPDLPPKPGVHATWRGLRVQRHGTLSLLAGIDLLTGKVHALVRDRHRSREFIEFSSVSTPLIRPAPRSS